MKTTIVRKCIAIFMALLIAIEIAATAAPKVLVVSVTKGFRHDCIPEVDKMIAKLAEKSGAFEIEYVRNDEDMARLMNPESLKKYDGVIFNNTTGDLPLPDRDAFLEWIKSGKGFVGLHAATDTFPNFPGYIDMIGAQFKTHGPQVEVEVINQDPDHPICKPFGPTFKVFDEIYQVKNFYRNKVHGLLTLDKHPNDKTPGDYPIAWCKIYGKGRVFYTSLGHRIDVVQRQDYQDHVLAGIKWSLGLIEGDATPQSTELKLSEQEIKDGFKPLFNGVDLKGWKLRNPAGRQSWSVQNGMLVNSISDKEHGTDLVSEEKFMNFTIRYEYMIPKGANSGLYLRGRYEIQILDDWAPDAKPSITGNGSLYNFAAPLVFASKKPGEWQSVEATIKGNRVTVFLNGVKIHDNVEITRPTGGELDNKLNEPGPIMLQGDHGWVAFRNMRIKILD